MLRKEIHINTDIPGLDGVEINLSNRRLNLIKNIKGCEVCYFKILVEYHRQEAFYDYEINISNTINSIILDEIKICRNKYYKNSKCNNPKKIFDWENSIDSIKSKYNRTIENENLEFVIIVVVLLIMFLIIFWYFF